MKNKSPWICLRAIFPTWYFVTCNVVVFVFIFVVVTYVAIVLVLGNAVAITFVVIVTFVVVVVVVVFLPPVLSRSLICFQIASSCVCTRRNCSFLAFSHALNAFEGVFARQIKPRMCQ